MSSSELFEKYYTKGSTVAKPYSFAVLLPKPKFIGKQVELSSNTLTVIFSTGDSLVGLSAYNAFMAMVKKQHPLPDSNYMALQRVLPKREKIVHSNQALINFISPLLIREHTRTSDYYYSIAHDSFAEKWSINVKHQLDLLVGSDVLVGNCSLQPVKVKKVIVEHYGQMLEGSLGIFKLHGSAYLINLLYKFGMGSRRSAGFGLFEILS